jgi:SAM-dependent methyltransferase
MLEQFRERLGEFPAVGADLRACDVLAMDVAPGSGDLVLCSMALHRFAERAQALSLMGRALVPGGVLGILAPGPAHDSETVSLVRRTGDPLLGRLADAIETNQVDPDVLTGHLVAAGLEPLDVFTETRRRAIPASAYSGRLDAVASHLWADLPPAEQEETLARMHALIENAADHQGLYRYVFVKTYAIARAPGGR